MCCDLLVSVFNPKYVVFFHHSASTEKFTLGIQETSCNTLIKKKNLSNTSLVTTSKENDLRSPKTEVLKLFLPFPKVVFR